MTAAPDLVITGGSIRTLDAGETVAEALAITGGRIAAVGTADDIDRLRGPRTQVLELRGETVLPGFGDAHCHPSIGGRYLLLCGLHDLPWDRAAYMVRIRDYAASHPDEPWIVGGGWAMPAFPNGTPSRHDLDAIVPDRPAFFENRDAHGGWANTRALQMAGITRDSTDPPDGRIEREPDGSPQGTLHEGAAKVVERIIPPFTAARWEEALLAAQRYLHGYGITAITDAWVEAWHVAPYRALAERGELTLRTTLSLWWARGGDLDQVEGFEESRRVATVGRLRASTVKLMLDGVLENFTGALLDPYLERDGSPTDNRGLEYIDPDRLAREFGPALDRAGFQLHFHAIGDRAARTALDTVEAVRAANGLADRRPHVAHLQVVHPADIPRFAELGVGATMQPLWACNDAQMTELTIPFLGPERAGWQYPFGSLERAGARLVGGSDWSISTPNVMEEVEVAVRRVGAHDRDAQPLLPEEAISLTSGLRAFTQGSAWAHRLEHETGILEAGRLADLCILDRDVYDRGVGPIGDATVRLTMVEGQTVYDPAGLLS